MYQNSDIVYLHHNKAGGSSIKSILREIARISGFKTVLIHPRNVNFVQNHKSRSIELSNQTIYFGGYSFGTCDFLLNERPCSYFTMTRNPFERAVSSYFYCKRYSGDQLCGPANITNMSIEDWAIYQGSYFFRQLLMHPDACSNKYGEIIDLYQNKTKNVYKYTKNRESCWFNQKAFLQTKVSDKERRVLLKHCLDNLERWFAVIGTLDNFTDFLMMLQITYDLPFRGYVKTRVNGGKQGNLTKIMAAKLMSNSAVTNALYEDLKIYEKSKTIFDKQLVSLNKMTSTKK